MTSHGCGSGSAAGSRGAISRGHVLGRFAPEERTIIAEAVSRSADAAELFIAEGIAPVMNRFNRKEEDRKTIGTPIVSPAGAERGMGPRTTA